MFVEKHLLLFATAILLSACGYSHRTHGNELDDDTIFTDTDYVEKEEFLDNIQNQNTTALPRAIDELFDDFIFNFSSNASFQLSRISFPLHLNAFGDDMVIERNEWQHQDLFDQRDYYTIFFSNRHDEELESNFDCDAVNFEHINLIDAIVRIFHFDRQDGRWMLTRELFTSLENHPIAGFLEFYHNFVSDSLFCQHSLSHNIQYITTDPDDDFAQIEGTLTNEQWQTFAPELPVNELTNIDYGQTFNNQQKIVMLKRGIANGLLDELTFSRGEHGWKLTRYEN